MNQMWKWFEAKTTLSTASYNSEIVMSYSAYDLVAHFITDFSITLSYTRKAVFSYINNNMVA